MQRDWWKQSVVYQIYPRSFCDSNGDGIGDLAGITGRLDYLKALGVDVVWLSPVYASPQDDNGYDISDYRAIAPEFGTLQDFDEMLAGLHARSIRLVMDLVVNHTSDEHAWFREARSSRTNPYHDWYIWSDPAPDGGPPTNWEAAFNGSVWEWNEATGEYYLHMFSRRQPDLNWENPAVRSAVHALMRFWLDRGVDGFRMDVINMISKPWRPDGTLPDAPVVRDGFLQPGFGLSCNGPRLVEFLREMRAAVLDQGAPLTVGEAPLATVAVGQALTHPESGALNMLFQFEHMDLDMIPGDPRGKWALQPLDLGRLKSTMMRWQDGLAGRGWNSLYLSNHDQPRPVSRFGDDGEHRVRSAQMLATWLHLHQGTPYVYQGEELGIPNAGFDRIEDYRDIESLNYWQVATGRGDPQHEVLQSLRAKSRDNARTPMPWCGPGGLPDDAQVLRALPDSCATEGRSAQAGFTTGRPWIAMNPSWQQVNAANELANPDSVFHHYRQLIALRHTEPLITHGQTRLILAEHPQVYAFTRSGTEAALLVLCNFSGAAHTITVPDDACGPLGARLIGNYPERPSMAERTVTLRPWEAVVLRSTPT